MSCGRGAAGSCRRCGRGRGSAVAGAGEPTRGDTCHLDVADRFGNLVSATPSGGWLQSSPASASSASASARARRCSGSRTGCRRRLVGGRRPRTTLSPSLALRDDGTVLAFGTPGGDQQDQWSLEFFLAHAVFGRDLQAAIDAPMFHTTHFPSSFYPRVAEPRRVEIEGRDARGHRDALRARGHDVVLVDDWSLGRLSAVSRCAGRAAARRGEPARHAGLRDRSLAARAFRAHAANLVRCARGLVSHVVAWEIPRSSQPRSGRLDRARWPAASISSTTRVSRHASPRATRPPSRSSTTATTGRCCRSAGTCSGNAEDGEDALQQTFLRAHGALRSGQLPETVQPWLFAIARNRCKTILAARRPAAVSVEDVEPSFDGLADGVALRADLRELVADLGRLPEDQRAALVLFELGGMSQAEIASSIGVPAGKVKALVFQARTELMAERDARSTPCATIREELSVARGGALRRGPLRRHLKHCEPCQAYRTAVASQRAGFASILPVAPALGPQGGACWPRRREGRARSAARAAAARVPAAARRRRRGGRGAAAQAAAPAAAAGPRRRSAGARRRGRRRRRRRSGRRRRTAARRRGGRRRRSGGGGAGGAAAAARRRKRRGRRRRGRRGAPRRRGARRRRRSAARLGGAVARQRRRRSGRFGGRRRS